MMVLLDTHALLWAFISPSSLSRAAKKIMMDTRVDVLVSAASAWEIATKVRLGKLPEGEALESQFLKALNQIGYTLVGVDAETALRAGRFLAEHKDPFDRMIAAQALELDIPVVSADAKLEIFGVRRIW